jgi:AraC-like DNA-binding protein
MDTETELTPFNLSMSTVPLPSAVLTAWSVQVQTAELTWVLPDGCQDLIWCGSESGVGNWFVTDLADTAYAVQCKPGEVFIGFRCKPGVQFASEPLLQALQDCHLDDSIHILSHLDECTSIKHDVLEALMALAQTSSVADSARLLGISERSLERHLQRHTNRTPCYWRNLARVRRAGAELALSDSLSTLAANHGYADQAHMSRAFKQWFGHTPQSLKKNPALLAALSNSGY